MKSRIEAISKFVAMLLVASCYQSCDSTLNIDKPATFIKYIGGDGNQAAVDMVTNSNGEIFILGSTTNLDGKRQVYVVKTNADGIVQWEETYGDGNEENPKDLELLSTGNLAIVADRDVSGEKDVI